MTRVVAIGLDAMEWSLAERLMRDGRMPTLARLAERGARCELRNVVPYRSELPWTLFITGKRPQDNRYWSTVEFDPATYGAHTVGACPAQPFYALGPRKKVIAFDVPHAVPDEAVHGVQVMAWGAHSPQYPRASQPRGLLTEIDGHFGPHPGFDNDYDGAWYVPAFLEKLARAQLEGVARRADILRWLTEREPDWDLLVTVMSEPHSAGHHLWHGADPTHPLAESSTAELAGALLAEVYEGIDAAIGRLLDGLPADTAVVVFAVHGMQPNANDVPSLALLPELLHRHHFGSRLLDGNGTRRWRRSGMAPVVPSDRHVWETTVRRRFGRGAVGRARRLATSLVPEPALEALLRVRRRLTGVPEPRPPWEFRDQIPEETSETLEEICQRRGGLSWQPPSWYRAHWPSMQWFVLPTFSDAHVRVNLAGRERDGLVPTNEYERACDDFEALVRACTNPRTGNPAVADVVRVRSDDPMDPHGPDADMVVLWAEPLEALAHPRLGLIGPVAYNRTGEHSSNGFAIVAAEGVEPADLGVRSAFDLPPTILDLLGAPTPEDLAGESFLGSTGART